MAKAPKTASDLPIIATRLKEAREAAGLSQVELAERVGMAQTGIGSIEAGESARPRKLKEIARAVGRTQEWLLGESDDEGSPQQPAPRPNASRPVDVPGLPTRRIPVLGQAAGGHDEDGRFILNGNKVADALVLPGLEDIKDLYAVYIYGESMLDVFRPGDTAYVDPSKPVVSRDDVVVQVKLDEHEPPFGFVKQFIEKRNGQLVLKQHNPPEDAQKTITFPLNLVVAVHKVVGIYRR